MIDKHSANDLAKDENALANGVTRDQTGGPNQSSLLQGEFTGGFGPATARDRSLDRKLTDQGTVK